MNWITKCYFFWGGGWFSYMNITWICLEPSKNRPVNESTQSTHSALSFTPVRSYLRCSALRVYFALSRWKSCRWPGEWQKGCAKIDVVKRFDDFEELDFWRNEKKRTSKKRGNKDSVTNSFWIKTHSVLKRPPWSINLSLFLSALHVPSHQQRCCGRFGW